MSNEVKAACNFLRRSTSYAEMSLSSENNKLKQVEVAKEAAAHAVALLGDYLARMEVNNGA